MRAVFMGLMACLVVPSAPAAAALVTITMSGTIAETSPSSLTGIPTFTQSPLSVGDTIHAKLTYDDRYFGYLPSDWGVLAGLRVYGLYGFSRGFGSYRVNAGPFIWRGGNDIYDGLGVTGCADEAPADCQIIPIPFAAFDGDVFKGFYTTADNGTKTKVPDLEVSGFAFDLREHGYYPYAGPEFRGSFDPSTVQFSYGAVPEPATWAMLILGFGLVGRAARHRRHRSPTFMAAP